MFLIISTILGSIFIALLFAMFQLNKLREEEEEMYSEITDNTLRTYNFSRFVDYDVLEAM